MHRIHIPVMGTGFSIDTPIRVAPFGISSVMSIMDDTLVEKVREHYCNKFNLDFLPITRWSEDSRAKRITAYINTVRKIVQIKFEEIKSLPSIIEKNFKDRFIKAYKIQEKQKRSELLSEIRTEISDQYTSETLSSVIVSDATQGIEKDKVRGKL